MASGRLLSTTAVQGAGGGDLAKIGVLDDRHRRWTRGHRLAAIA